MQTIQRHMIGRIGPQAGLLLTGHGLQRGLEGSNDVRFPGCAPQCAMATRDHQQRRGKIKHSLPPAIICHGLNS